jgi:hypothetical protein
MDLIHDQLAKLDSVPRVEYCRLFSRECFGLVPVVCHRTDEVVATPIRLNGERGDPTIIRRESGTGFTAVALDH